MTTFSRLLLLGWAFFVLNSAGEPYWKLCCMTTPEDCQAQRKWMEDNGKKVSPCFQEFISQLQK